jgi:hypothetical protein
MIITPMTEKSIINNHLHGFVSVTFAFKAIDHKFNLFGIEYSKSA